MPTIPAEGSYSESEKRFIETSPPGLWPENQNSIFGQIRKVLTDEFQARRDEIQMLSQERFIPTSSQYLSLWEEVFGVAIAPTGKTNAQRQAILRACLQYGRFTRAQRNAIIEALLGPTVGVGDPAAFGPSGIPILTGIPLYGSPGSVTEKYRVYESQDDFTYQVWIDSGNVPDVDALTRELKRVTPAGISFTIDTSHAGTALINWALTMESLAPSGWWKLGADYNDYSGLNQHGTVTGAPAVIAAPGLISSAGSDGARDFSGTGQYVVITDTPRLDTTTYSFHAVVRADSLPASGGNTRRAYSGDLNSYIGIVNYTGDTHFVFGAGNAAATIWAVGTTSVVIGTIYNIVGTYDGTTARLYVNGVEEGSDTISAATLADEKVIGGRTTLHDQLWDGGIDEVAFFGRALTPEQVLYLSNSAKNIL